MRSLAVELASEWVSKRSPRIRVIWNKFAPFSIARAACELACHCSHEHSLTHMHTSIFRIYLIYRNRGPSFKCFPRVFFSNLLFICTYISDVFAVAFASYDFFLLFLLCGVPFRYIYFCCARCTYAKQFLLRTFWRMHFFSVSYFIAY